MSFCFKMRMLRKHHRMEVDISARYAFDFILHHVGRAKMVQLFNTWMGLHAIQYLIDITQSDEFIFIYAARLKRQCNPTCFTEKTYCEIGKIDPPQTIRVQECRF